MLTRSVGKKEFKAILTGKIPAYDAFEETTCGFFEVIKNGKCGILNDQFKVVLAPIYNEVEVLENKTIIASKTLGVYQIFSETGKPITTRTFANKIHAKVYAGFFIKEE